MRASQRPPSAKHAAGEYVILDFYILIREKQLRLTLSATVMCAIMPPPIIPESALRLIPWIFNGRRPQMCQHVVIKPLPPGFNMVLLEL